MATALIATVAVVATSVAGCGGYKSNRGQSGGSRPADFRRELFQNALSMLTSPEQFADEELSSSQLVERLTQWARAVRESSTPGAVDASGWSRDAMLDTLPESLQNSRWLRGLAGDTFDPLYDGKFLQESVLLCDVVNTVRGSEPDDLSTAQALFDWTVRNIQIVAEPRDGDPAEQWMALHLPGETVFYGQGTPLQRAWVFMLLARQAGLNVVLLATPAPNNPEELRPWVTALVDDGELYLFDYTYGLPIPGPGGKGIATLTQAATDDAVLRQMDVPGDRVYPKNAKNIERVTALLEASPGYLTRRMKLVESQLTGRNRVILSFSPTALAEKLKDHKHIGDVHLWTKPLETLVARQSLSPALERAELLEKMPFSLNPDLPQELAQSGKDDVRKRSQRIYPLRTGRLLHLRGIYDASDDVTGSRNERQQSPIAQRGAKYYYLLAMPSQRDLQVIAPLVRQAEELRGQGRPFDEAIKLVIERKEAWTTDLIGLYRFDWAASEQRRRDDAVYWMGLLCAQQGDDKTAVEYLGPMLLEDTNDDPWTSGAQFNLAQCYERLGKTDEAIKLYEADRSPQRYGNRLRAQRLKQEAEKK